MKKLLVVFLTLVLSVSMLTATGNRKMVNGIIPEDIKNNSSQQEIKIYDSRDYILEESFEGGTFPPADWSMIDADGDTYNWEVSDAQGNNGTLNSAKSASYENAPGPGAMFPDNYLITPVLSVGSGSELTWAVCAQDPAWAGENYAIMVSTTGTAVEDFTDNVFEETLSSGDWLENSVDLSAYAGQNIYVAFRHYNCTDMFWLMVDEVRVSEGTVAGPTFEDDMEAYTAGTGLVAQSDFWNNWSNGGAGDDAMVTTDQASSGVNSFVVEGSSDIIAFFEADTLGTPFNVGTVRLGSQYMVGAGMGGYFNLLHDFTEYRTTWAVEAYFASDGTGYLSIDGAQEAFTYTNGAWFGWEVLIDMDADTAEFFIDGVSIHAWQWSLGASAGTSDIRFQAQNFYAAAPTGDTAQYFVDDYYIYLDNAGVVGINDTQASVSNFELNQNYPNPFNPTTSISFSLENNSNVQLAVFDAKGALVANLVNGNVNSGAHSVEFNAAGLSTGVYYYTLNVNNISTTKKMMLLK